MAEVMSTKYKIALIENDVTTADYIKEKLEAMQSVTPVRVFNSAEIYLRTENKPVFDVCLIDINLKDMNGIELAGIINENEPDQKIVMLTSLSSDDSIFKSLKNGAIGYILKSEIEKISEYLKIVFDGGAIMSAPIALRVMQVFHPPKKANELKEKMTTREKQALQLLSEGHTSKEAADQMNISVETLRGYIKNIYRKLQVQNRVEMLKAAQDYGIV